MCLEFSSIVLIFVTQEKFQWNQTETKCEGPERNLSVSVPCLTLPYSKDSHPVLQGWAQLCSVKCCLYTKDLQEIFPCMSRERSVNRHTIPTHYTKHVL